MSAVNHIGLILDGNRRYAKKHDKPLKWGHEQGQDVFIKILKHLAALNIKEVSAYVLSTENLDRPHDQVEELLNLAEIFFDDFDKRIKEIPKKDQPQIHFASNRSLFSKTLQDKMLALEKKTEQNTKKLNLCFGYGGRDEIVRAARKLQDENRPITLGSLTEMLDIPSEPELIIRTGNKQRTSNFLLWQSAYSEWFFIEKLWPEIKEKDIDHVLDQYQKIQRNFGK